jgi:mRNA-degrading endonuclease YafQ of YafQ-DinJ toxin-antitoxin module
VADGGQWTGCVRSHVHTDRLLVWDTLEDFFVTLTI